MTNDHMTFQLPKGYTDEAGTLHREVEIRSLTGKEEELLARYGNNANNEDTGPLDLELERCLNRMGAISPVPANIMTALAEQDRLYLLWALLQNTFGDRVQGTVSCTGPGCGKPVDIDFSIRELLGGIAAAGEELHTPLEMDAHCPECTTVFPFPFHMPRYLLKRLRSELHLLYHEVHFLAYHYHWGESEILDMSREKRKMYIDLLAAEIEGMKDSESSYSYFPQAVPGLAFNPIMPESFPRPRNDIKGTGKKIAVQKGTGREIPAESSFTGTPGPGLPEHENHGNEQNPLRSSGPTGDIGSEYAAVTEMRLPGEIQQAQKEQKGEQKGTGKKIAGDSSLTGTPVEGPAVSALTGYRVQEIHEKTGPGLPGPGDHGNDKNPLRPSGPSGDTGSEYAAVNEIRLPGSMAKEQSGLIMHDASEMNHNRVQPMQMKKSEPNKPGGDDLFMPSPGKPVRRLGFIQPPPSFPVKKVNESDGEETPGERIPAPGVPVKVNKKVITTHYSPPASPTPSAFWERMFLGHFRLKFLR